MTTSKNQVPAIGSGLLILLAFITALDAMAIDMYLPGMPLMASSLGVSGGDIQQTLTVFLVGLALGQGIYGPLLDRFGRRLPLLVGLVIFVAGSFLAASASSLEMLLVARFIQALGASAGLVAPRAIIDDIYDLDGSAKRLSILMQVMMVAPIVAPILGGVLLEQGGWHDIFWIMGGIGLIVLIWAFRDIPDSLPKTEYVPFSIRNTLLSYSRLLSQPKFLLYALSGGLVMGAFFTYISGSSLVFIDHFGVSSLMYSQIFALNSLGLVIGGVISNRLLKQGMTVWSVTMFGITIYAALGFILYLLNSVIDLNIWVYGGLLGLAIASLGLVLGNLIALTMDAAKSTAGISSALMGMMQYLISAIVGFISGFAGASTAQLPVVMTLCGTTAALLCLLGKKRFEPSAVAG